MNSFLKDETQLLNAVRSHKNLHSTTSTTGPQAQAKPHNDNKTNTTENKDSFSFSQAIADGSKSLLFAAGRGVGRAASSVGDRVFNVASRFVTDTAKCAASAAICAGIGAATFALAGPAIGLAAVGAVGVGAGVLHHALAPPNPNDAGLSKAAARHNRLVDSACVGALAASATLIGLANVPTVGLGVALATATGAATGMIGSIINQTGEALGILKKAPV